MSRGGAAQLYKGHWRFTIVQGPSVFHNYARATLHIHSSDSFMPPKKRKSPGKPTKPDRKAKVGRHAAGEPWYPSTEQRMKLIDSTRVTVDAGYLKGDLMHTGRCVTRTEVRTGARWDGPMWRLLDDDMYLSNAYVPNPPQVHCPFLLMPAVRLRASWKMGKNAGGYDEPLEELAVAYIGQQRRSHYPPMGV